MEFSVVIPAYNEEKRLAATLNDIMQWFKRNEGDYHLGEIIVVDDGSTDKTEAIASRHHVTVLRQVNNQGKGAAVAIGVNHTQYEAILVMDADGATKISELPKLMPFFYKNDIVIGSRYAKGGQITESQVWYRRLLSRMGNLFIRSSLHLSFADTQCGFKLFHRQVAKDIFARLTIKRWGFDVELLVIARQLGYKVVEVGVTWSDKTGTKVRALSAARKTFEEVLEIRRNIHRGIYTQ